MNTELERRWRAGAGPFDGLTVAFASEDLVPTPTLRRALLAVTTHLQQLWPDHLLRLYDWHEHDGFVTEAERTSWQVLSALLASDAALLAANHGDWAVRLAYFPPTYDLYLRIYVPADYDDDYPERRGDFDVTCSPELAHALAAAATPGSDWPLVTEEAKSFFDVRYGG